MRYGLALLDVEKPGRYEGLEAGAVVKDWDAAQSRVALCFPDVYEIGMSHLGLPLLYHALNRDPRFLAERAYAPWMDMEALLRRNGWPLVSRESGRALAEFDLVGFTLQYELSATNVLAMLELGGIPLLAAERSDRDPLVLGGGPVASNPEPLADFFDAYFLGDGEEGIIEIARCVAAHRGEPRAQRLTALAEIPGVYVPGRFAPVFRDGRFAGFGDDRRVRRRTVSDLDAVALPERPLVPFIGTVHERLALEIARGCTRGCRFCQAGYLYRPVRERSPETLRSAVRDGLAHTGFDEVGLLSLSTGDYSCIGPLLVSLMEEHADGRVAVSLPSLRVDSLDPRLLEEIKRVRKTGFTVAPEAGTARLRAVINKNITREDILGAARTVFAAGWKGLKLYFMIGLPTETREDWQGIVDLVKAVEAVVPAGRGKVSVSISNFVPKPHTPFQWCRQLGAEEVQEAQAFFRTHLRGKKIDLKWHDAGTSSIEGVLARGDRRLGAVVLGAYRRGARMDGWSSEFRPALWEEALGDAGLTVDEFLRERGSAEPLPWDGVDVGVSREYLLEEWRKALAEAPTADCRDGECTGCGLCDFQALLPRTAGVREYSAPRPPAPQELPTADLSQVPRLRFRFHKLEAAALLSHLEVVAALHRALRSAGVDLVYSQGFHPHPKLQLGPALPLGTESRCELGEVKVWTVPPLQATVASVNQRLPAGLQLDAVWVMSPDSRTLTGGGTLEEYRVELTTAAAEGAAARGGLAALVQSFWNAAEVPVVKRRKNKPDRVLDARRSVVGFWAEGEALVIRLQRDADGSALTPEAFLHHLTGLPEEVRACSRVLKRRGEIR